MAGLLPGSCGMTPVAGTPERQLSGQSEFRKSDD